MSSFIKALRRPSSGNLKHKKLCEEWGQNREPVVEGITFFVKYVGSCLVEEAKGEQATADAIKTIVAMTKNGSKKLDRVSFTVNPKGVKVTGSDTSLAPQLEVPIYRISYCSADAYYDHVFAFIAINKDESLECHAFLCPKKKIAHAVTLTISQAFNLAFESWQHAKGDQEEDGQTQEASGRLPANEQEDNDDSCHAFAAAAATNHQRELPSPRTLLENAISQQTLLIDIEDDSCDTPKRIAQWNFEDDFTCELNFEEFIQMRFYPQARLNGSLTSSETPVLPDFGQCFRPEADLLSS